MKRLENYIKECDHKDAESIRTPQLNLLWAYGQMLNDLAEAIEDIQESIKKRHNGGETIFIDEKHPKKNKCTCKVCKPSEMEPKPEVDRCKHERTLLDLCLWNEPFYPELCKCPDHDSWRVY